MVAVDAVVKPVAFEITADEVADTSDGGVPVAPGPVRTGPVTFGVVAVVANVVECNPPCVLVASVVPPVSPG